jgi:hypothetical protein
VQISVDLTPLIRSADRFSVEMGKSTTAAFLQSLRGMVRRFSAITPPASRAASGVNSASETARPGLTTQDRERGILAMEADLRRIFKGYGISSGRAQRRAGVEAIERIHKRLFAQKTPGRKLRSDRPNGDPYYVDEDALQAYIRKSKPSVGWTASGLNRAFSALGIRAPAWVANLPGQGSVSIRTGITLSARISNDNVPDKLVNEINRRLQKAVSYQVAANERAIKSRAQRLARSTGLSS